MIVKWIRSFAYLWYDVVVGDDWRLVVGVVAALGLTGLLTHTSSLAAWWIAPVLVLVTLVASRLLAARKAKKA